MEYIEPKDSTRNLLKELGIEVDSSRKRGYERMLVKDGEDLGYYSADNAHAVFINKKIV